MASFWGAVCISVCSVTATGGSALTAGHFWKSRVPDQPKVTKNALPHHSAPRLGSVCPHSGIAPWARREGPSMAQRGYPGILPGCPLHNACVQPAWLTGRPRSTSTARRPYSRPDSWWDRVSPVGAGLLTQAVSQSMKMLGMLAFSRTSPLPQWFCVGYKFVLTERSNVGASLLAMTAVHSIAM
ncbi:hypothetical protein SAMN03159293_01937 [Pseudomonas sp. NFACC39-1]|nr:hypothetical protein SAMN03159293_01937 [Pseudomonas sp. NFACC39-1]